MNNKPWSIQIGPVEGCTRLCPMCGLNAIREGKGNYKYMALETVQALAVGLAAFCPTARVEFALHGEPLIHPRIHQIISIIRAALPKTQIQITTNGSVLAGDMQTRLTRLFQAGIDFVILDTYAPERDRLRSEARTLVGIQVADFYDDWVPKGISPWHNHRRQINQTVVLMDDLLLRNGETKSRTIYNHAGNNALTPGGLAQPLQKKCTLPFREMSVLYDGSVPICCMDWGHEHILGNVNTQTVEQIWNSPQMEAVRRALYSKNRNFSPCARCDYPGGGRMGLLEPQSPVTEADWQIIGDTIAASPKQNRLTSIYPVENHER